MYILYHILGGGESSGVRQWEQYTKMSKLILLLLLYSCDVWGSVHIKKGMVKENRVLYVFLPFFFCTLS